MRRSTDQNAADRDALFREEANCKTKGLVRFREAPTGEAGPKRSERAQHLGGAWSPCCCDQEDGRRDEARSAEESKNRQQRWPLFLPNAFTAFALEHSNEVSIGNHNCADQLELLIADPAFPNRVAFHLSDFFSPKQFHEPPPGKVVGGKLCHRFR